MLIIERELKKQIERECFKPKTFALELPMVAKTMYSDEYVTNAVCRDVMGVLIPKIKCNPDNLTKYFEVDDTEFDLVTVEGEKYSVTRGCYEIKRARYVNEISRIAFNKYAKRMKSVYEATRKEYVTVMELVAIKDKMESYEKKAAIMLDATRRAMEVLTVSDFMSFISMALDKSDDVILDAILVPDKKEVGKYFSTSQCNRGEFKVDMILIEGKLSQLIVSRYERLRRYCGGQQYDFLEFKYDYTFKIYSDYSDSEDFKKCINSSFKKIDKEEIGGCSFDVIDSVGVMESGCPKVQRTLVIDFEDESMTLDNAKRVAGVIAKSRELLSM